jgi:hypothetical protein
MTIEYGVTQQTAYYEFKQTIVKQKYIDIDTKKFLCILQNFAIIYDYLKTDEVNRILFNTSKQTYINTVIHQENKYFKLEDISIN